MKAFPIPVECDEEGMELRDYFAAKAMVVFLAKRDLLSRDDLIAQDAYAFADSMMEARKK